MQTFRVCWVLSFLVASSTSTTTVTGKFETEIEEFLEMVPYEQVLNLGMEYAMSDPQVKSFFLYVTGHRFRGHLSGLQQSDEFNSIAERLLANYSFNIHEFLNNFSSTIGLRTLREKIFLAEEDKTRIRRTPGDGVVGFVKEVVEITPLSEMKETYNYKLSSNPEFKIAMENLLNGEIKRYFHEIEKSKHFQDIKKDLEDMGLPLNELCELLGKQLHEFFDIEATSQIPTYVLTR